MNDSFDCYKKIADAIVENLNRKIEVLQKENDRQRKQINDLYTQLFNIMGNVCFDTTCKLRKGGLTTNMNTEFVAPHNEIN